MSNYFFSRAIFFVAASFLMIIGSTNISAAANSNACLQSLSGPTVTLRGNFGFETLSRDSWTAGTIFDARGAKWESHLMPPDDDKNCFPIQLNAPWGVCRTDRLDLYANTTNAPGPVPQACFSGGLVVGTQTKNATWGNVKSSSGYAITINAVNAIVEGMRVHNHADGFVPMKSQNFTYRHNWQTYTRDDCIENDAYAAGIIDSNLFDGCYVFYSALNPGVDNPPIAQGGGKQALVKITNNLIRMQNMPGPSPDNDPSESGYGNIIKAWDGGRHSPGLEIRNNIFLIEASDDAGSPDIKMFSAELRGCSNNTIVWDGPGSYPGSHPKNCFTVTKDMSVWNNAKAAWIADHPDITRLPGDPGYNASTHAISGAGTISDDGGTGTPPGTTNPLPGADSCNTYQSGDSVGTGFGVPWSTLSSSRPLLLNSQCQDDEALLRAGTGSTVEYIYKTGYTWDGSAWDPITFSGSQLIANTWYVGDAYHVLSDVQNGTTFWVAYVCTWTGQVWKCGCRDNSCGTAYWQLQGVVR